MPDNGKIGGELPDRIGGSSIKQHKVENEYDSYLLPGIDQNASRARQQGLGSEMFNGISRAAIKVIPNVIGNVAAIVNYEDYLNQDDEVGNYVTASMQELGQAVDNFFPIYEKAPGEALSFGDSAWWVKNMSQVLGSAAEFAITGAGVAGAVGKGLQLIGATGKIGQGVNLATNVLALNQAEALVSAQNVYKNAYELNLKKGLGDDEAKQVAADAAAYTININRLNIPLNLTSSALFLKTPIATRSLVDNINRATTLKRLGLEGAQEYGEEVINHVAEKAGTAKGAGENYNVYNTLKDIFSEEGLEAGLLGAFGGVAQTAFTEGINEVNGKNDDWRRRFATQKADFEFWDDLRTTEKGQEKLSEIIDNIAIQSTLANQIYQADLDNNVGEADRLRSSLLQHQALNAFKNGTTQKLVDTLDWLASQPNAEERHGKDYTIRASLAKKKVEDWEKQYNSYIGKFPEEKVEPIFNAIVERDVLETEGLSLLGRKNALEGKIASGEMAGTSTEIEKTELASLLVEEQSLNVRKSANASDIVEVLSPSFKVDEYKRRKIESITGKPLSNEAATKVKAEKAKEEYKAQQETDVAAQIGKVTSIAELDAIANSIADKPKDISIALSRKRDELRKIEKLRNASKVSEQIKNDLAESTDLTPLNNKKFTVTDGKYNFTFKVRDGKLKPIGRFYANGNLIPEKSSDYSTADNLFKGIEQIVNKANVPELQRLIDSGKPINISDVKTTRLPQASEPPENGEDTRQGLGEYDEESTKQGLNEYLPFDSQEEADKQVEDPYVLEKPTSPEEMKGGFLYKSHTAFRTTDRAYKEAVAGNVEDSVRWQRFVNTYKGSPSDLRLKVFTSKDPEYKDLRNPIQKAYEDKTGKTGVIVALVDLQGNYVYPEGEDAPIIQTSSTPSIDWSSPKKGYKIIDGVLEASQDSVEEIFDIVEKDGTIYFRVAPGKGEMFLNMGVGDYTGVNLNIPNASSAVAGLVGELRKSGKGYTIVKKLSPLEAVEAPKVERKPLLTTLLKNEKSKEYGPYVDKDNMAKHMGLTDPVAIEAAYKQMWKDTEAFRERLMAGEIKYLPINGMGKGVPVLEKEPQPLEGRIDWKTAELHVAVPDFDPVNKVYLPYQIRNGKKLMAGRMYAYVDGEPYQLFNRKLEKDDIGTIVDALKGLKQGSPNNTNIEEFVRQYTRVSKVPPGGKFEAGEQIMYIRGNSIYYGVGADGKSIKLNSDSAEEKWDDLRRWLTTKYTNVVSKKLYADAKYIDPDGTEVGSYREFLFTGARPRFLTNVAKQGELWRVNNYFTYSPQEAGEPVADIDKKNIVTSNVDEVKPPVPRGRKSSVIDRSEPAPVVEPVEVKGTPLLEPNDELRLARGGNITPAKLVTGKIYKEYFHESFSKDAVTTAVQEGLDKGISTVEEMVKYVQSVCKK